MIQVCSKFQELHAIESLDVDVYTVFTYYVNMQP